jgi:hypothetical protein
MHEVDFEEDGYLVSSTVHDGRIYFAFQYAIYERNNRDGGFEKIVNIKRRSHNAE